MPVYSSPYSSPLDHLGLAFLWAVGLIVTSSCSLGLVWVFIWVFELSTRVLALAGLPWLLLVAVASCSPFERSHVLAGSAVTAAMCFATAWWLS